MIQALGGFSQVLQGRKAPDRRASFVVSLLFPIVPWKVGAGRGTGRGFLAPGLVVGMEAQNVSHQA